MIKTLRWLLVIPGAVLAWNSVFVAGIFLFPMIESALCPPDDMISGTCMNQRVQSHMSLVVHLFAGVSALAVVFASAIVAPARKKAVAWLAFVVGATVATALAVDFGGAISELVSTISFGLSGALFWTVRRRGRDDAL